MLLMVFWGSLGLVLGALGGFLGALWVPLRVLGSTLNFQNLYYEIYDQTGAMHGFFTLRILFLNQFPR